MKFSLSSIFILTISSISAKMIRSYNQAISDKFAELGSIADNSPQFGFYDCFNVYNHPAIFTGFAVFIFLTSFALTKFTKTLFPLVVSFLIFAVSLLQARYLSVWFPEVVNIEWNSLLIQPDVFDSILYIFFALTIFLQIKIIYRFAIERFHAKISLR